jgi:hypothetical protein
VSTGPMSSILPPWLAYARAFCVIASNSVSVIAPLSRSYFAFSISEGSAAGARRLPHAVVELPSLATSPFEVALRDPDVLRDEIDEDA